MAARQRWPGTRQARSVWIDLLPADQLRLPDRRAGRSSLDQPADWSCLWPGTRGVAMPTEVLPASVRSFVRSFPVRSAMSGWLDGRPELQRSKSGADRGNAVQCSLLAATGCWQRVRGQSGTCCPGVAMLSCHTAIVAAGRGPVAVSQVRSRFRREFAVLACVSADERALSDQARLPRCAWPALRAQGLIRAS